MKRILFVDDESRILDGLRRVLRPMSSEWEMAFAPSGGAALLLLETSSFDVIVTDMCMPGMDGAALLEVVRGKYPSMLRILLSGYTELQASLRAVPVAHHHHPRRASAGGVDMILVVYTANLLAHEICASEIGLPPPEIDEDFLQEAGALVLLPEWRKIAAAAHSSPARLVT
jgi:CheY-like chemotaxis protein